MGTFDRRNHEDILSQLPPTPAPDLPLCECVIPDVKRDGTKARCVRCKRLVAPEHLARAQVMAGAILRKRGGRVWGQSKHRKARVERFAAKQRKKGRR